MAKKAELELAHDEYQALILQARQAKADRQYDRAIDLAIQCWVHVDSMMRYAQKYQDREFDSLECIDLVLELAPPLFHFESLDKLAALLKEQRRIDKQASADLAAKLAEARARMWEAHRAWSQVELQAASPCAPSSVALASLPGLWESLGLLVWKQVGNDRVPGLAIGLDEQAKGKCSSCGAVAKAKKARFLSAGTCPRCKSDGFFVFLRSDPESRE